MVIVHYTQYYLQKTPFARLSAGFSRCVVKSLICWKLLFTHYELIKNSSLIIVVKNCSSTICALCRHNPLPTANIIFKWGPFVNKNLGYCLLPYNLKTIFYENVLSIRCKCRRVISDDDIFGILTRWVQVNIKLKSWDPDGWPQQMIPNFAIDMVRYLKIY